ncbi:MAG: DUF3810 domain-containing protein [Lachnospiraceae bacterium]|nr:DUF3810 domain-containing protein [Lachnospiraceae bacterium]
MEKVKDFRGRWFMIAACILLAGAAGLLWAARKVPGFAEWYSKTVYPVLVTVVGGFFGLVPVSVVELFLYGGVALLIFLLIKYRRKPMVLLQSYGLIFSVLLFLYAACCGVNYYRVPFSSYYIQDILENPKETKEQAADLRALCAWLTEEVNKAHDELAASEGNFENMQKKGIAAMERLAERYPSLAGDYPQPKPVMVSEILSVQQCSGVYSPFTIEANYNNDMVSYNIPHTICHEMSHLRGFMREDEANFIGYLACLQSEDADFRYSGYMLGWIYAGNALAKVDYEEYARLHGLLKEEINVALAENTEFWDRYEGEVAEVQEKVNDAYLKANGQAEGVLTYGRVVDLMLIDFALNRT